MAQVMSKMPPMQPIDLGKAIRRLFSGNSGVKRPTTANPIQTLVKGVSSALQSITKKPVREDYENITTSFLPPAAALLTPQNPKNASKVQLAELDQDAAPAVIASYRLNGEIRTMILKKKAGQWYKAHEINSGVHESLHYRGIADVTGEGKNQLLLGAASSGKANLLSGYTFSQDHAQKLFEHNYHRIEVMPPNKKNAALNKTQLALWNQEEDEVYRVDLLQWNSHQLEPVHNSASYYASRLVPYHAQKAKEDPGLPANWYRLADALAKSGAGRDAMKAIQVGMQLGGDPKLTGKFSALKSSILSK